MFIFFRGIPANSDPHGVAGDTWCRKSVETAGYSVTGRDNNRSGGIKPGKFLPSLPGLMTVAAQPLPEESERMFFVLNYWVIQDQLLPS
jgi:hypothetical protein